MTTQAFHYDPYRQGNSLAVWRYPNGLATQSGYYLGFKSTVGLMYYDCGRGNVTFVMNIPSAPSTGDSRQWGLRGSSGYAWFSIIDSQLFAQTSWEDGTYADQVEITWDTAWNSTDTNFRIAWKGGQAIFYINDIARAVINAQSVPGGSMSPYVANGNETDTMLVRSISGVGLASLQLNPQVTSSDSTQSPLIAADKLAITEHVSLTVTYTPSVNDSITVSDSPSETKVFNASVTDSGSIAENLTVTRT